MARALRTYPVDRRRHGLFLQRADELAASMESSESKGLTIAAGVAAVQCAIACADAVCVAYLGERSAGKSHEEAAELLAQSGAPGARERASQLKRILTLKSAVEYSDRELAPAESRTLIDRTRRLHQWAQEVIPPKAP
jgi:hypothetical protein